MNYEEIKIDRRTAIRAEIDAAIRALSSGDYVPAHVLAFAAKGQLRGIAKSRRIETFDDEAELYIVPKYVSLWRKAVNSSYNFFKHANDDPDLELNGFRPETTVIGIFTAVVNYGLVYRKRSFLMTIMFAWALSRHPNFAKESLRTQVEKWKVLFAEPESKPLNEALRGFRNMVAQTDNIPNNILQTLASPDVDAQIEW